MEEKIGTINLTEFSNGYLLKLTQKLRTPSTCTQVGPNQPLYEQGNALSALAALRRRTSSRTMLML